MPMLDMQRRSQQIGRIRVGQQVPVMKDGRDTGKTRPATLATFRFTTGSQVTAEAIAALYGGDVRPWDGHRGQFEVITAKSEIWVSVPPRDAVVSQWYEKWGKSGIERRCDSVKDTVSDGPCQCPQAADPDDPESVRRASVLRGELAKQGKACARVTRINVMIPDLPGLGVFRLDTGSFDAATEVGDKAQMMEMARNAGVFLKAMLRIEWRERGSDRKPYPVPVLEILDTVREIVSGELAAGGMKAQLPPAPGERLAIAAGPPRVPLPEPQRDPSAKEIYAQAQTALSRSQIEALIKQAETLGIAEDMVCTDEAADAWGSLRHELRGMWQDLPRPGGAPGE